MMRLYLDQSILDFFATRPSSWSVLKSQLDELGFQLVFSFANIREIQKCEEPYREKFISFLEFFDAEHINVKIDENGVAEDSATISKCDIRDIFDVFVRTPKVDSSAAQLYQSAFISTQEHPAELVKRLANSIVEDVLKNLSEEPDTKDASLSTYVERVSNKAEADFQSNNRQHVEHGERLSRLLGGAKKLCNYEPHEVFQYIGTKLQENDSKLMEYIGDNTLTNASRIQAAYAFLNTVGYYRDKSLGNLRKAEGALNDMSHALCAAFCHSVWTRDERQAKKMKAIYSYLGIKVQVLYFEITST